MRAPAPNCSRQRATLYAARPFDQVTVDDVVGAARRGEGHILCAFRQPRRSAKHRRRRIGARIRRIAATAPAERWTIRSSASPPAAGRSLAQALRNPAWGALVAHSAAAMPNVAGMARKRLKEDIDRAARDGRLGGVTSELAFDFANGIVLHTMLSAPRKRRSPAQASAVVAGILRAIGVAPDKAATVAERAVAREQR